MQHWGVLLHRWHLKPVWTILPILLLLSLTSCRHEGPQLTAGPMIGLSTATSAEVWVAADQGHVSLRYWPRGDSGEIRRSAAIALNRASHGQAQFRLHGLRPDTTYFGQVILDDHARQTFQFRTLPRAEAEVDFRIALGSCAYLRDSTTDRGPSYGGDPRIFHSIVAAQPLLMLWLGDSVYYRDSDLQSATAMRRRQMRIRQQEAAATLFRSCANLAIWDDHDFGPNDSDGSFAEKRRSKGIFREFWPNSLVSDDGNTGLYFRQVVGDVEIFATDGRFHRSPNRMVDGPQKTMLGLEQRDWLIKALAESQATFKMVLFGGQVLNPICRFEGMAKFSHERDLLLAAITKARVTGVLFLSGDRHHSELIVHQRAAAYPLYDLTCSPLLSGTHGAQELVNPARVPGSYMTDQRNFGLLEFSGRAENRALRVTLRDIDGLVFFEKTIRANDLR